MTGMVILITGVWTDKQEQQVVVNEQAAVTAILQNAAIQVNGDTVDDDLARGSFRVVDGSPIGFVPVRNHGTVEETTLLVSSDPVLLRDLRPFDGAVEFDGESPGELDKARVLDSQGSPLEGALVMRGRAMQNGSPLTAWAFRRGLAGVAGGYGNLLVTLAVFLFGLSTAISWSYYGDRSILYLAGPRFVVPYRIVFCLMHFLGAVFSLEVVWAFGDMALGLMTLPNLLSILLLTGQVKRWTREYVAEGKLEPPIAPR
jgi:AGCS family alanine or glycine:cation symporter